MTATITEADFERVSWHDCCIWGINFRLGDPAAGDWTSDLALDIDFILEWLCGVGAPAQFRVAPTALVFHGVTDLSININWGADSNQVALYDTTIDRIEREPVHQQKVYLDRPYYRWRIVVNSPPAGQIAFGAVGFTQTVRAEGIVSANQRLSLGQRSQMLGKHGT